MKILLGHILGNQRDTKGEHYSEVLLASNDPVKTAPFQLQFEFLCPMQVAVICWGTRRALELAWEKMNSRVLIDNQ